MKTGKDADEKTDSDTREGINSIDFSTDKIQNIFKYLELAEAEAKHGGSSSTSSSASSSSSLSQTKKNSKTDLLSPGMASAKISNESIPSTGHESSRPNQNLEGPHIYIESIAAAASSSNGGGLSRKNPPSPVRTPKPTPTLSSPTAFSSSSSSSRSFRFKTSDSGGITAKGSKAVVEESFS